jgi:hypothetical protein
VRFQRLSLGPLAAERTVLTELPFAGKVSFFVYIVESPSAVDIYHKRSESDLLQNVLELEGIPSVARLAISRSAFYAAMTVGIAEEMKNLGERIPIIHLSSHGNAEGIGLSSGEVLDWDELRRLLVPINKALQGKLLVAMSCCDGYSGIRMAMTENPTEDLPFAACFRRCAAFGTGRHGEGCRVRAENRRLTPRSSRPEPPHQRRGCYSTACGSGG